jgi:hypothetical protein
MKTKFVAAVLVAAMVCINFAIGVSVNVQAGGFMESLEGSPMPPNPGFVPKDVAWKGDGSMAMVVGYPSSSPHAYLYYPGNNSWFPLTFGNPNKYLNGVCWDNVHKFFWVCGNYMSGTVPVYYYELATGQIVPLTDPGGNYNFKAIAVDNLGNPLVGAYQFSYLLYYNAGWFGVSKNGGGGPDVSSVDIRSITFNPNDFRFYAVGEYNGKASSWFTEANLSVSMKHCYSDYSPFITSKNPLNSIEWNPTYDAGVAIGNGIYKTKPYNGSGNYYLNWSVVEEGLGNTYKDISFDKSVDKEAGIVGLDNQSFDSYWRYYFSGNLLIKKHTSASAGLFTCVGMKPPASPKWAIIPVPAIGGGWKVNIQAEDDTTRVTLNAAFPHIFNIDFREASTWISRLNQQVDAGATYTFVVEANYTVGGQDLWLSNADLNITAWYDEGFAGTNSNPTSNWAAVENRTRQFSLQINGGTGVTSITYPTGAPNEFAWVGTQIGAPTPTPDFHYSVFVNVTFRAQTWAADGDGVGWDPPVSGYIWAENNALNDMNSWDFMVTVYDKFNTSASNTSYEEFGVKRAVSITAAGNPTGNAPPGTNGVALAPTSQIMYSANCNYTVNVSIPDLYLNGIVGPYWIPAANLYIQNIESVDLVNTFTSEISTPEYFQGAGLEWLVWGNRTNPGAPGPWEELNPPYNGTTANGPYGSNFNTYVGPTEVQWWANVQAGIPEGTYWAVITFTIWNP